MAGMDFPSSPTNGQTTTDGRYYFDSSVGASGAWRSTPLPVGGLPAGSIIQWGSGTLPANWLLCDGSAVSRSTYSSLYAAIGTTYGTGDGTTTFNLPDLRGRVPVGKNAGTFGTLGATGGAETHTLTEAQMPSHNHDVTTGESGYVGMAAGGSNDIVQTSGTRHYTFFSWATANKGGGQAHNNLQPYQVVNYIIKTSAGWTAGDSELATRLGAVEQKQILSPNYIINGAFDIWQRGTSVTNSSNYLADRWQVTTGATGTQTNQSRVTTTLASKLGYALRVVQATSATSVVEYAARQPMERGHIEPLAGKTVTLSFWYRSNKTGTHGARIIGSGSNNVGGIDWVTSFTVSTADVWQRYSVTSSAPFGGITAWGTSNPTDVGGYVDIGFKVGNSGAGFTSLSTNDYFEITGVQLEEGSQATTFRRNAPSIQAELAACQRYFQKSARQEVAPFSGTANIDTVATFANAGALTTAALASSVILPVPMRASPTVVIFDNSYNTSKVTRYTPGVASYTNQPISYMETSGTKLYVESTGTNAAGFYYMFTASAEL